MILKSIKVKVLGKSFPKYILIMFKKADKIPKIYVSTMIVIRKGILSYILAANEFLK
jgi:hypothetical protein